MYIKLLFLLLLVQHNSGFIHKLKDLVDSVNQKIKEEWEDLTEKIKDVVADVKEFAKASVNTLNSIKQDLLANLKNLKALTNEQFQGIRNRLKNFTFENLKSFLNHVNEDVIKENWATISEMDLLKSQKHLFANISFKVYGEKAKDWSSDQIKSLKKLLPGLPTDQLKKFSKDALSKSVNAFCDVGLSTQQKVAYVASLTNVFGNLNNWKRNELENLCDNIEALSPEEILQLSSKEITEFIEKVDIKKFKFTKSQQEALLKKIKERWGDAKSFSTAQFKRLQNAVQTISLNDIKDLDKEKFLEMIEISATDKWDMIQSNVYLREAVKKLGDESLWSDEFVSKALPMLSRLNNITKVNVNNLMKAINTHSYANWTLSQARYILAKDEAISTWSATNVVKRGQLFEAMLQSDFAKIGGAFLLAAFPELIILKILAPPTYRFLVKVWRDNDGDINNLHQFANALTRQEISEQNIVDILQTVEKLANVDFNEAQMAAFMYKLKIKLGDLNATDSQTTDLLPWGFQNLKKMGKIVVALTKDEIRNFPMRDIVYSVEVMGQQDSWKRKMVLAMTKRLFDYWEQQNKTLGDLTEMDIESMGKFVQGLKLTDLEALSEPARLVALQKLGEFTGLPEDKLRARATYFYNHIKKQQGDITANDLKMMGTLLNGLSSQEIRSIPTDVIMNNIADIMKNMPQNQEGLREILNIYKENVGESDLSKWTANNIRSVMETLKTMSGDEINSLSKETFEEVLGKLGDIEEWSRGQKEAIIQKMKQIYGEDVSAWNGEYMDKVWKIMDGLLDSDIAQLTASSFQQMSRSLYDRYISGDKKEKLAQRFETVMKQSIDKLSTIDLKRFEGILSGFTVDKLRNIQIKDVDTLAVYGQIQEWSKDQLAVLKEKAKSFLASGKTDDYLSLGNILKGYDVSDIESIPKDVFKLSAGAFGNVKDLDKNQLEALIKKAKESWDSNVADWNDDAVAEAGYLLGGLEENDVSKIKLSAIPYIKNDVLHIMNDVQIQAFTADQLNEFNVDQINAISDSAKTGMSQPQVAALKSVENEDPYEAKDTSAYSKSISLSAVHHLLVIMSMMAVIWAM